MKNGIILIDKPRGMTSAKTLAYVKKLIRPNKGGHGGTLDPFATGLLICCIGQGTKLARFFLHSNKTYQATLYLGVETDTQDLTGSVISEPVLPEKINFSQDNVKSVLKQFEGPIEQQPPVYSALKYKGVPLYKLARQGKIVRKPARQVFISSLKLLEMSLPQIRIEVSCGPGTYIRTLGSDIGAALGCGAHLTELRRTQIGPFTIKDAISLEKEKNRTRSQSTAYKKTLLEKEGELENQEFSDTTHKKTLLESHMITMADALQGMPKCIADDKLSKQISFGQQISKKDICFIEPDIPVYQPWSSYFKVIDANNNLLAILNQAKESDICEYCCVMKS